VADVNSAAAAAAAAAGAFERKAWAEIHQLLSLLSQDECSPGDLERLAVSRYLMGLDDEAVAAWEAAHQRFLDVGDRAEAGRCGFWVAFCSMMRGQMSYASGWLSRSKGVIGDDPDCPAAGYLLVPAILRALDADDAEGARELATTAGAIATRHGDADLAAFSTLGLGQTLLAMGDEPGGWPKRPR